MLGAVVVVLAAVVLAAVGLGAVVLELAAAVGLVGEDIIYPC
jgi:hypothetical protein